MTTTPHIHALALLFLALAALLWGAVAYGAYETRRLATARASSALSAEARLDRDAHQRRLAALAEDTVSERDALDARTSLDVVAILTVLEKAGRDVGTDVQVNDAQAEGIVENLPTGDSLRALGFIVEALGSYASLMRLVSIYEHLPLISEVRHVEIERLNSESVGPWRATIRVRVYTTAPVSV